jgi:hypothetical protein
MNCAYFAYGYGVGIPVTGPTRFDVEAITQLNFRF